LKQRPSPNDASHSHRKGFEFETEAPKARNVIAWANGPGWFVIELKRAEGAE
jgi:hypothetical protein